MRRNRKSSTLTARPGLCLERLEDRRVLATFTVTELGDGAGMTLRNAIDMARASSDGPHEVVFDSALAGETIVLTAGEILIAGEMTIDASELTSPITIDASGNDPTPGVDDGAGSRIFRIPGNPSELIQVTLKGLQLTGGDVDGSGGAIWASANFELIETRVIDNFASVDGGGVYVEDDQGELTAFQLLSSEVVGNRAGRHGGGIATRGAFFDLTSELTISDNVAAANGGGIYHAGWLSYLRQSQISGNTAANGGGVFVAASEREGALVFFQSTVSSNLALEAGGGIAADDVRIDVKSSTISDNEAGTFGGGLWVRNDPLQMSETTVVDNISNTNLSFTESTGGGIYIEANSSIALVARSVVANNSRQISSDESVADDVQGETAAFYSLIETSAGLTANSHDNLLGIDPQLAELADNGGFGLTHLPLPTSPLIDAGGPPPMEFGELEVTEDQRGLPRYVDGDADGTATIDMGEVERQDANQTPIVDAGEDALTRVDEPIQLNGFVTAEPTAGPLTYLWEVANGPPGANFDDTSLATPTFTSTSVGTYELRFTANDRSGSAFDLVIIEVVSNQPPFANVDAARVVSSVTQPVQLDGQRSFDFEMDQLAYAWSVASSPPGSNPEFTTPTEATTDFSSDAAGEYGLRLVVSDADDASAPFDFSVVLTESALKAGGPYLIAAGQDLQLQGPRDFPFSETFYDWDLNGDGDFSDAVGAAPLVPWSELEILLGGMPGGLAPSGVFPIAVQITDPASSMVQHSALTVRGPGRSIPTFNVGAFGIFGDIDGDGDVDAVGREPSLGPPTPLVAFINDGSGQFTLAEIHDGQSLLLATASALADLDGDDDLDLIVTPGSKPTTWYNNDGAGNFTPVAEFASANTQFRDVHVVDIDSDQDNDVTVLDQDGVWLYANDGRGKLADPTPLFFQHQSLSTSLGAIERQVVADFDGNGHLDMLFQRQTSIESQPSNESQSNDLWLNQGDGQFVQSVDAAFSSLGSADSTGDIQPADLDGDGDADLVDTSGRIHLYDARGDFFDAGLDVNSSFTWARPRLADMNRDGRIDIVGLYDGDGSSRFVEIYFNDGLGTFSQTHLFSVGPTAVVSPAPFFVDIYVEDFDGDDLPDILSAGTKEVSGRDTTEIFYSEFGSPGWHNSMLPQDVDGSGQVSPLDALLAINELNDREFSVTGSGILAIPPSKIPAYVDVIDDGVVSPADPLVIINWLTNIPELAEMPDVTLLAGSPLMIPLDGATSGQEVISYTATSSDDALVSTSIPASNRSLRMTVSSPGNGIDGEMVFELFENYVPRVTSQIIQLAESGFYDGLTFHRILDDFVIQGGDPNGDGTGGSDLPDFDDQYHPHLQHNQTGVLSMAKSYDDTNNSQFFVTEGPSRHLDFNHSIFGYLVEGEDIRQAVSDVPASPSGQPESPVVMERVEVFVDQQNATLMLKAPAGASGVATVMVTASVGNASVTRTFQVAVAPDTHNSRPFLDDLPPITAVTGSPTTYQLRSIDVEADEVFYFGPEQARLRSNGFPVQLPPLDVDVFVDESSGLLSITPRNGYAGTFEMTVGIGTSQFTVEDFQTITVTVV